LTANRQAAAMAEAPVGAYVHEPFDIHGDLLAQVSLHASGGVNHFADPAHFLFREILNSDVGGDPRLVEDPLGSSQTDSVDVGKPYLDALVTR
jgi:hypothetical protein